MTPFPNNILHTIHCSTERTTTFANHAMHNWNKHAMYSQHPEGNLQIRFTLFRHYFCTKSLHSPTIYDSLNYTTSTKNISNDFRKKNETGTDEIRTTRRHQVAGCFPRNSVHQVCRAGYVCPYMFRGVFVCVCARGFGGMCAHARSSLSAHEPSPFVSGTQTLTASGDAI